MNQLLILTGSIGRMATSTTNLVTVGVSANFYNLALRHRDHRHPQSVVIGLSGQHLLGDETFMRHLRLLDDDNGTAEILLITPIVVNEASLPAMVAKETAFAQRLEDFLKVRLIRTALKQSRMTDHFIRGKWNNLQLLEWEFFLEGITINLPMGLPPPRHRLGRTRRRKRLTRPPHAHVRGPVRPPQRPGRRPTPSLSAPADNSFPQGQPSPRPPMQPPRPTALPPPLSPPSNLTSSTLSPPLPLSLSTPPEPDFPLDLSLSAQPRGHGYHPETEDISSDESIESLLAFFY